MKEMAILIDIDKCTACRACQVACKSWNQLKAEATTNRGDHENPHDLSACTWNRISYKEVMKDEEKINWMFFSERCRHCDEPPCMYAAEYIPGAIIKHESGAIIFTDKTRQLNFEDILNACPFDIPRLDTKDNRIYKCNFCIDRIINNLKPACVTTCSTGALQFGTKESMLNLAYKRIKEIGGNASLYPGEEYHVLWIQP
jgi:formate dehydrogenase iron-sulfur subunit